MRDDFVLAHRLSPPRLPSSRGSRKQTFAMFRGEPTTGAHVGAQRAVERVSGRSPLRHVTRLRGIRRRRGLATKVEIGRQARRKVVIALGGVRRTTGGRTIAGQGIAWPTAGRAAFSDPSSRRRISGQGAMRRMTRTYPRRRRGSSTGSACEKHAPARACCGGRGSGLPASPAGSFRWRAAEGGIPNDVMSVRTVCCRSDPSAQDDAGAIRRARKQRGAVAQHEEVPEARSCIFQEAQRFGEEAPIIAGAGDRCWQSAHGPPFAVTRPASCKC